MLDLRFISDTSIRQLVERDIRELETCCQNDLHKSTLLLAGSIIEAVLVDFYIAFPRPAVPSEKVLQSNLGTLVGWALEDSLVSAQTADLSTVIRNYRNLIHPGREFRLKEKVNRSTANVAKNLVEIVIEEIGENYAKRLGYTAEQAIHKVKVDPTSISLLPHIVDQMVDVERIKLFRTIPEDCIKTNSLETEIASFVYLHHLLKAKLPQDLVLEEALKSYDNVRTRSKTESMQYLRFFQRELGLLKEPQKNTVLSYILDSLTSSSPAELARYHSWNVYMYLDKHFESPKEYGEKIMSVIQARQKSNTIDDEDIFIQIICDMLSPCNYFEVIKPVIAEVKEISWLPNSQKWSNYMDRNIIPF